MAIAASVHYLLLYPWIGLVKQLFPDGRRLHPVVQTPDWAIFSKPPGMETVSLGGTAEFASVVRAALDEPGLTPVHRLDRDTSGALLFARNRGAESALVQLFRRRLVEKTYLAICLGMPRNRTGTINRNLSEWEGGRRPVRVLKRGGLEARTAYEVLAVSPPAPGTFAASLVAFRPHQGRTHQIRVHAAAIGHPILGDDQYGDRPANKPARDLLGLRRQALHSWKLAFPWNGGKAEAVCPLWEDMARAARAAFGDLPFVQAVQP